MVSTKIVSVDASDVAKALYCPYAKAKFRYSLHAVAQL